MRIVFDLDGTLANCVHRLHYIKRPKGEKKDWDSFHRACVDDSLIVPIHALYWDLIYTEDKSNSAEIWSGRNELVRPETEEWMRLNQISFYEQLRMRPVGDYRDDAVLKEQWLNEARVLGKAPDIVFDDRQRVVDMWRRNGITCCQVAPGDF